MIFRIKIKILQNPIFHAALQIWVKVNSKNGFFFKFKVGAMVMETIHEITVAPRFLENLCTPRQSQIFIILYSVDATLTM